MMDNRKIDVRTITSDGPTIRFSAAAAECATIAERFDVPRLQVLDVQGTFAKDDLITFTGQMHVVAERTCVATLKPFIEDRTIPVHLLFSESPKDTDNPEEDILPIKHGKIDLLDVFAEEFGLTLNPFPKSTTGYTDYIDPNGQDSESPFAVLKKLKS